MKIKVGFRNGTGRLTMAVKMLAEPMSQEKLWNKPENLDQWYLVSTEAGNIAAYAPTGGQDMIGLNRSDNFNIYSSDESVGFTYLKESLTTSALKMPEAPITGKLMCGGTLDIAMGKDIRNLFFTARARMTLVHGVPDEDAVRILEAHNVSHSINYRKTMETNISDSVERFVSEYEGDGELPPDGEWFDGSLEQEAYLFDFDDPPTGYHIDQIKHNIVSTQTDKMGIEKDVEFWKVKLQEVGLDELLDVKAKSTLQFEAREEDLAAALQFIMKSIAATETAISPLEVSELCESFQVPLMALKQKLKELQAEEKTNIEALARIAEEKKAMLASVDERMKESESKKAIAIAGLSAASERLAKTNAYLEEIKNSLMEALALI